MAPKKSEKANLENKRSLFFQLGLIISLCLSLVAFEWASPKQLQKLAKGKLQKEDMYVVDFVVPEQPKQKQKSAPKNTQTKPSTKIKITAKATENKTNEVDSTLLINPIDEGEKSPVSDPEAKFTIPEKPIEGYEADVSPSFPGGYAKVIEHINKNMRIPFNDNGGSVHIAFVVDKEGNITDVSFAGGKVSEKLKSEAIKAVANMPKWNPGIKDGKPVAVKQVIPINVVVK